MQQEGCNRMAGNHLLPFISCKIYVFGRHAPICKFQRADVCLLMEKIIPIEFSSWWSLCEIKLHGCARLLLLLKQYRNGSNFRKFWSRINYCYYDNIDYVDWICATKEERCIKDAQDAFWLLFLLSLLCTKPLQWCKRPVFTLIQQPVF